MRWRGETIEQWKTRAAKWQRIFALVPHQLHNGNWVWLEPIEKKLVFMPNDRFESVYRLAGDTFDIHRIADRPPPPVGIRASGGSK